MRPNPPPIYLGCEVQKNGKFVGNVICSSDPMFLPFKQLEGYTVPVIATGGAGNLRNLHLRLRNFNAHGKTTTNIGTGKKRGRRPLSALPEENTGDKR